MLRLPGRQLVGEGPASAIKPCAAGPFLDHVPAALAVNRPGALGRLDTTLIHVVSLRISLHLAPGRATLNGAYILNNDGAATGFAVCRTEILLRRLARAAAGLQIIGPSRVGDLGFGADRSRRALRLGLNSSSRIGSPARWRAS